MEETAPSSSKRLADLAKFWRESSRLRRFLIMIAAAVVATSAVGYLTLFAGLPDIEEIKNYQPVSTGVISEVQWRTPMPESVRFWVPLNRISRALQRAVVISEDDSFFQHDGVNVEMMKEAFAVNWKKKRYVRGASTITMQLARNAFLHKRKTLLRKAREIILARRIEQAVSKQRILELYLNIVEWGENVYGAEAAARYYFSKSAATLSLAEASLLAGMLPNPIYFNPYKRMASCRRMQQRVLKLMDLAGEITSDQARQAQVSEIVLRGQPLPTPVPIDIAEESQYFETLAITSQDSPQDTSTTTNERAVRLDTTDLDTTLHQQSQLDTLSDPH